MKGTTVLTLILLVVILIFGPGLYSTVQTCLDKAMTAGQTAGKVQRVK